MNRYVLAGLILQSHNSVLPVTVASTAHIKQKQRNNFNSLSSFFMMEVA